MKTIMSPMKDDTGRRLGTVLEWFDRTQEVATESELHGSSPPSPPAISTTAFRWKANASSSSRCPTASTNSWTPSPRGGGSARRRGRGQPGRPDAAHRHAGQGRTAGADRFGHQRPDRNLAALVSQAKKAAAEVSRGADEISQGNANLSQRTEEQASSLEETASSMEEMTSTVKQNADNARQANQLAVGARDQAEKGGAVVAQGREGHGRSTTPRRRSPTSSASSTASPSRPTSWR